MPETRPHPYEPLPYGRGSRSNTTVPYGCGSRPECEPRLLIGHSATEAFDLTNICQANDHESLFAFFLRKEVLADRICLKLAATDHDRLTDV